MTDMTDTKIIECLRPEEIENLVGTTLLGQEYIGNIRIYDNPNDGAFGQWIERKCDLCFFRTFYGNPDGDCHIQDDIAKRDFGYQPNLFMQKTIGGNFPGEVAWYCRHFFDFRGE